MREVDADPRIMEQQIWTTALERLQHEVNAGALAWLRNARLYPTHTIHKYILQVGSRSIVMQLKRCHVQIERAVQEAVGGAKDVSVTVIPDPQKSTGRVAAQQSSESLFPETNEEMNATPPLADVLPTRGSKRAIEERRRKRDMRSRPTVATHDASPKTQQQRPPSAMNGKRPSAPPPPVVDNDFFDDMEEGTPAWLNSRYTFDTFIVGGNNHFAYAASMAVADEPGQSYNPLFLYGGVGLGKTHLMHAIAHNAPKNLRSLYVTSETFTNEIINAIRYRTTEEFRAKYRSVDILLVDDIQFIAGKESTEEEFFHTFNALHEAQKQIVMCSDRPPKAIDLAERLRSRFEWGLIVDIQPPELETRLAILRTKAELHNLGIADDVLAYLAERVQTNVRELEGMLNRVVAFSRLHQKELTPEMAQRALMNLAPEEQPRRYFTAAEILTLVILHYKITLDELRGKRRDKHIVFPRQIAMWLMRNETSMSLMDIGHQLGGRDHSTIIHGCDKIDFELRRENGPLLKEITMLRRQLMESPSTSATPHLHAGA